MRTNLTLIQPTASFESELLRTWHYATNPLVKLNEDIHSIVRLNSKDKAIEFLKSLTKKFGFKNLDFEKIYEQFKNTSHTEMMNILKPLNWVVLPIHVKQLDDKINNHYKREHEKNNSIHPFKKTNK